ncbi:hypothetical protein BH23ACT6_BH23ACT6_09550 [soil metagenome]
MTATTAEPLKWITFLALPAPGVLAGHRDPRASRS